MKITRRGFNLGLAGAVALPGLVSAQSLEKPKLTLGVGGKPLLYYLPLTIAERKGFFKEQGLDVEINDLGGGAKALQSLIGGSVDVVTGAYEHTIRMQAKGQDVRALIELGRFPAIVVGIKKDRADKIKSVADFKGLKFGVTAPGSSTHLMLQYAMVTAGLKPDDAVFVGVGSGAGAVAAIKKGELDGISHLDPVISKLETDGDIVTMIDTRTEAGTKALFGGTNPAAVLYAKGDFIEKNPETTQRLVNAFKKALVWLSTAKPEDVIATVPEEYFLGDKETYGLSLKKSLESYSRSGIISAEAHLSVMDMLAKLDKEFADTKIGIEKTFTDRFVKKT